MTVLALLAGGELSPVRAASVSPGAAGRTVSRVTGRPAKAPGAREAKVPWVRHGLAVMAATTAARRRHARVAVAADQTAFSQTFVNPDGTLTSVVSAQPRWVARGKSWVRASADLVRSRAGSWSPAAAETGLQLSGGGSRVLARVSSGGQWLSVSWPSRLPVPRVSGASATYASVFPGVDLVVTARVSGAFEETLVVRDAAAAKDPQLQGLVLGESVSSGLSQHVQKSGAVVERNARGKAVFSSPPPVAWDSATPAGSRLASTAAGPGRGAHVARVAASYGAGSVRMRVPAGLLSGASTVYPVYVDPAYTISQAWEAFGEIQSAYPTAAELNDTFNGNVSVGDDGGGVDRGFYVFGLPSQADGANTNVISASMTAEVVTTYTSAQVSHTINAYSTAQYTSTSTWNSAPAQVAGPSGQTFSTASQAPDQNVTWNVGSWVQTSLQDDAFQFSSELVNSDETNDGTAFLEFASNATLSVTYDQVPAVPVGTGPVPNATFLPFSISDRVSLQVNAGSGNALLTTSDITLPQIGSSLTLGAAYNSLSAGWGPESMGANGWSQRQGIDVELYPASDGSVTFLGPDGTAGKFTPSGSGYTSPPIYHVTLVKSSGSTCGGTGYTMTWHATGQVMCFNPSGLLTSQADRDGNTTTFTYNSENEETKVTYTPHGAAAPTQTVTVTNTECGCYLTGLTETGGTAGTKTVSYTLDNTSGNISSMTQPDGTTISFGYDAFHDLTSITNGDNIATTLTYNSAHQVTSVTQPTTGTSTATTRFDYVSATETQVADPNTNQSDPVPSVPNITYTINSSSSLVTKTVDQAGDTRSTTYNGFNQVLTSVNANGASGTTTNTYGTGTVSGESLVSSKSPTGATSSFAYGNAATGTNPTANFQPSSATDAQANKTAYTYDGAGNLEQSSSALPATAKVTSNSDGTPATSTDPANGTNATTYTYNSSHQLTKITPPTGSSLKTETLTYDGFGRVATVTDGNANTVTYTYDLADRITKAAYTGGTHAVTVTSAYDAAGNLKTQTDPSGTTTYGYDGRNLVTAKTATSGGGTLSYGYDADGNLTSVQDAGGTTTYAYTTRNLLASLTDPAGELWEFAYNADGQRTTTWSNTNTTESTWGAEIVTSYDTGDRISRIQAYRDSTTADVVSDVSYCYSKFVSGQSCPTATKTTDTSLVQYSVNNQTSTVSQYTYDAGNRLTQATNIGGKTYAYTYDSDGNLKTGAAAGSLSYNSANQISTTGYAYDGTGNLTTSPANGTLSYNDASQLTTASNAGGHGAESFTYAGATQDQVLSDGSATGITYGLAGQDGQPQIQSYTTGGTADYVVRDQNGTPLGMIRSGTAYAFVTDNLGSITNLISSCGCTSATYTYDPYGNQTSETGAQDNSNLLGYTGALTDRTATSTSYLHLGSRWYAPATGAFTTQDTSAYLTSPANGNRYAYAADNPANNTDPTGQSSCSSSIVDYATLGGFLTGTGEGAIAVSSALAVEETVAVTIATTLAGGLLGAVFGIGLVVVAIASC
jgi:RHS repeat-associated protein